MDAKIKGSWVKALRSGEYKQGQGSLHNGVGFCCLGVLCDIEIDADWLNEYSTWSIDGFFSKLPTALLDDAMISRDEQDSLVRLNDGGTSFQGIANWIEDNL